MSRRWSACRVLSVITLTRCVADEGKLAGLGRDTCSTAGNDAAAEILLQNRKAGARVSGRELEEDGEGSPSKAEQLLQRAAAVAAPRRPRAGRGLDVDAALLQKFWESAEEAPKQPADTPEGSSPEESPPEAAAPSSSTAESSTIAVTSGSTDSSSSSTSEAPTSSTAPPDGSSSTSSSSTGSKPGFRMSCRAAPGDKQTAATCGEQSAEGDCSATEGCRWLAEREHFMVCVSPPDDRQSQLQCAAAETASACSHNKACQWVQAGKEWSSRKACHASAEDTQFASHCSRQTSRQSCLPYAPHCRWLAEGEDFMVCRSGEDAGGNLNDECSGRMTAAVCEAGKGCRWLSALAKAA
eukprot:TRINITY_DN41293_c0_g1_i1.p2 TRINITY_DN41293_c0_g1~~TRINITY_DN41293_c0_g1_i1.p2  ORF type:complete len:354 (-),score=91.99 TRINITY_DN41293_c0_g1_i1:143-1204(-)